MLTEYIHAAMRRATYEILSDGTFYGEIPGLQGVYANAKLRFNTWHNPIVLAATRACFEA